ncbi:NAD(P)-binding protein [Apiospora marii]|uniref:NAD(P)-binding protein n=1 Tax=Apiospora marii TaxID=335849 RepID=A0ABR1S796_9PEZI
MARPADLDFRGGLRTTQESALLGLWARELARRHPKLLCFSLNPGSVSTGLVTDLNFSDRAFIQMTNGGRIVTPEQGAYNHLWAISAPRDSMGQGGFYEPVGVYSSEKGVKTKDERYANQLWEHTDKELERFMS